MCIIIFKPAGVKVPSKKILKNCFDNNPDGAGFMFPLDNKMYIRKGFMDFGNFFINLMDMNKKVNLIDLDLVIHFRIATQGVINTGNCHPFPVSDSVEDLKSNSIKTPVGIAHNGSISFCEYKSKLKVEAELSDTQIFILRYLSQLPREILFNRTIVSLIEEATQSKFVLMSPKRTVLIGEFLKDKGVYYSNRSYLEYYWIDKYWCSYCGNYTQGFEYMDDWLCEDCCMVLSDELNIELF